MALLERHDAQAAATEWRMPLIPDAFDRGPDLSLVEQEALAVYGAAATSRRGLLGSNFAAANRARRALVRLERPVMAVSDLLGAAAERRTGARRVLYAEMLRRGRSFWGWSRDEWIGTLCPSAREYLVEYGGRADEGRMVLMHLAYLLGGASDLRPAGMEYERVEMARVIFGADRIEAGAERLGDVATQGLGYRDSTAVRGRLASALCLVMLLNRSPALEAIHVPLLQEAALQVRSRQLAPTFGLIGLTLDRLGLLTWPGPGQKRRWVTAQLAEGAAEEWAAWCWAWYHGSTRLTPATRRQTFSDVCLAGRWLAATHPGIVSPEQWDEDLALEFVRYTCDAKTGELASPGGRLSLAARGLIGRAMSPRAINARLGSLRRAFTDWQDRPHVVGGQPARKIPVRFRPQQAFETPAPVRALIQPDPRDIDLRHWYKLAYAAATLTQADLTRVNGGYYPLALYRALALLWVTAGRRPNELARLRVGCVRRDWDPTMLDDTGLPLDQEAAVFCYLHVPANKTRGPFWVWIPEYAAAAVETWQRERPAHQPPAVDPKDGAAVDFLFSIRGRRLSPDFLNKTLIPVLCGKAGVPERDARGQITAHRGRSTRATLLRKLGVPLEVIADYLGHADQDTVRSYARTDMAQFAHTLKKADDRSRWVEGLIDTVAAQQGKPAVFFALGTGPDGSPRYCGNPAWASCIHRLACKKCAMYVGATRAELLEAKAGVIRFRAAIPMTPEEQAACDGDLARLDERLAALRSLPPPEPPSEEFVFNPTAGQLPIPVALTTPCEPRTAPTQRLADLRHTLAMVEQQKGSRSVHVRALKNQIAELEAQLQPSLP